MSCLCLSGANPGCCHYYISALQITKCSEVAVQEPIYYCKRKQSWIVELLS